MAASCSGQSSHQSVGTIPVGILWSSWQNILLRRNVTPDSRHDSNSNRVAPPWIQCSQHVGPREMLANFSVDVLGSVPTATHGISERSFRISWFAQELVYLLAHGTSLIAPRGLASHPGLPQKGLWTTRCGNDLSQELWESGSSPFAIARFTSGNSRVVSEAVEPSSRAQWGTRVLCHGLGSVVQKFSVASFLLCRTRR